MIFVRIITAFLSAFLVLFWCHSASAESEQPATSLTVYSAPAGGENAAAGYAVIRQKKLVTLAEKESFFSYSDMGAPIDPTTVLCVSLTDPALQIMEQSYRFDLTGNDKLLDRYIGHEIEVQQARGDTTATDSGVLVSREGGITLQDKNGSLHLITSYSAIRFPKLAEEIIVKPTLLWKIHTEKPGKHILQISYQMPAISWWADYHIVFNEGKNANNGEVTLSAFASIANQSAASYSAAAVKLMAGDIQRVQPEMAPRVMAMQMMAKGGAAPMVEEKPFYDYHLYTLKNPITLPAATTRQAELFPTISKIPAERLYRFNGQQDTKVATLLRFGNNRKSGLGIPLPAGKIRAYMVDKDGLPEFIGEDRINHIAKDEQVEISLGNSSDIIAKRKMMGHKQDNEHRQVEEQIQISLSNRSEKEASILVTETLNQGQSWTISGNSEAFTPKDAQHIEFAPTLARNETKVINYTVKYTW